MNIEGQTESQTQENLTDTEVSGSVPETIEQVAEKIEAAKAGAAPVPEQAPVEKPAFVPNYKYKAYEKEYEIPEQFRALIKDEATNAEIRKIFEKATGFDGLMPKYQRSKSTIEAVSKEYTDFKSQVAPVLDVYNKATRYLQRGDLDSLFETLGIGDEALQKHMLQKLTLTGTAKDAYTKQREALRRQYELEDQQVQQSQEANQYKEQYESLLAQQRTSELQTELSRPEIAELASQFDARHGQGAFFKEVVQRAIFHHQQTGEDLTAKDAVTNVANLFKPMFTTVSPEAAVRKAEAQVANTVQKKNGVPVIPNVGGRNSSPVTKEITSLDELRAKIKAGTI